MIGFYMIIGAIALASWLVSNTLKNKFKKYSKIHLRNGMSGAEIAEKMLADHGIKDVKVVSTTGMLTDHYDPRNKTVNLSASVYSQRNAASAAVAAHEVGHAVQHAQAYEWLTMRSKLAPGLVEEEVDGRTGKGLPIKIRTLCWGKSPIELSI